jgi:hypothetical protein
MAGIITNIEFYRRYDKEIPKKPRFVHDILLLRWLLLI